MRSTLALAPLLLALPAAGQTTTDVIGPLQPNASLSGAWEEPFMHEHPLVPRWNAIHMSVIPKGPHRGKVLTWDAFSFAPQPDTWEQRFGIVDVTTPEPTLLSSVLRLPSIEGDLFCAGHAWMPNGNLFIAGGTLAYPGTDIPSDEALTQDGGGPDLGVTTSQRLHPGVYQGGRLAFIYDPSEGDMGRWHRQPNLQGQRWYPSVTLIPDGRLIVTGGIWRADEFPRNDYEVFVPNRDGISGDWERRGANRLFRGPANPTTPLMIYPRLYHLSSGELFLAGMASTSVYLDHPRAPGQWRVGARSAHWYRSYCSALLLPYVADQNEVYEDVVVTIGGEAYDPFRAIRLGQSWDGGPVKVTPAVNICEPNAEIEEDRRWRYLPPLKRERLYMNALVLPDRSILVLGGRMNSLEEAADIGTQVPELFDGERWRDMEPHVSPRTYHSTAVLLPDGRVLTGGGDSSTWDYQVFHPPYLFSPWPRPVIQDAPARMRFASGPRESYEIHHTSMPPGSSVERVVLVSPGSVTHHWDFSQRSIELIVREQTETSVTVKAPDDPNVVLPGYYMMFLVSNRGVPSEATWVQVKPARAFDRVPRPAPPR